MANEKPGAELLSIYLLFIWISFSFASLSTVLQQCTIFEAVAKVLQLLLFAKPKHQFFHSPSNPSNNNPQQDPKCPRPSFKTRNLFTMKSNTYIRRWETAGSGWGPRRGRRRRRRQNSRRVGRSCRGSCIAPLHVDLQPHPPEAVQRHSADEIIFFAGGGESDGGVPASPR